MTEWRRSQRGARLRHAFIDGVTCSFGLKVRKWGPADTPTVCDTGTCSVCWGRLNRSTMVLTPEPVQKRPDTYDFYGNPFRRPDSPLVEIKRLAKAMIEPLSSTLGAETEQRIQGCTKVAGGIHDILQICRSYDGIEVVMVVKTKLFVSRIFRKCKPGRKENR